MKICWTALPPAVMSVRKKLDGIRVHRVKFACHVFSWEAWIAAEGDPILQKVVVDITDGLVFAICSHSEKISATITQRFKDWRFDRASEADSFVFTPLPGATKSVKPNRDFTINTEFPSVGKRAPNVELDLCVGGQIKLGRHIGKDIVVLVCASQFFNPFRNVATTLRLLAERVSKQASRRVSGQHGAWRRGGCAPRGEAEDICRCCRADERSGVAKAFGVDTTSSDGEFVAIIDKQGVIQAVHDAVGLSKAQLKRELDALLAGRSLAANGPKRETKADHPSK